MSLSLSDLIATYPLPSDRQFAGKIAAKQEFAELQLGPEQPLIPKGDLFPSQKVIQRILGPESTVDGSLLIQEPGVGKTCAATAVAETYKHALIGPGRRKALVVLKGDTIEDSFKDNLTRVCTTGEYLPREDKARTQSGRRGVITTLIHQYYDIVHYIELAREIQQLDDQQVEERYSDRVIIFDEAHHLRMGYFAPTKNRAKATTQEEKEFQNLKVYSTIHRMLHLALRTKLLLLTGTPIIDRPEEMGLLLNLLLPLDNQIPPDYPWDQPTLETLEPYMRGLISYVRSSANVPPAREQGSEVQIPDVEVTLKLELSPMLETQAAWYTHFRSPEVVTEEKIQSDAFRGNERYAAMFVFPPTTEEEAEELDFNRSAVGVDAFNQRVRVEKNGAYELRDENLETILSLENLPYYSCKFARTIELLQAHPEEVAFVYTEFVRGPGAILFGLALEANGWTRYDGRSGLNPAIRAQARQRPVADDEEELSPLIGAPAAFENPQANDRSDLGITPLSKLRLSKARRYAIITGETSDSYIKNTLEIFNAPENRYGEYIHTLIGSGVTKEGLSFLNARQVHLLHPGWNSASSLQAIKRTFRETSQQALPLAERYVNIYQHAAVLTTEDGAVDAEVVDIEMYIWAERKAVRSARVLRIAKQCAFDCALHRRRNQERGEVDGSRTCDYEACEYQCVGVDVDRFGRELPQLPPDDSTYFLYYSGEEINRLKQELAQVVKTADNWSFEELRAALAEPPSDKYLLKALNELITHQVEIPTEFGTIGYLKEVNDRYFLQLEIATTEQALATYARTLLVNHSQPLRDFILPLQADNTDRLLQEIESLTTITSETNERIFALPEEVKAQLYERALLARTKSLIRRHLLTLFANRAYQTTIDGQPVYFHDILTQVLDRTKYNATTKSIEHAGRIRVLGESGWRFVFADEEKHFFDLIKEIDDERIESRFGDQEIYGILSSIDGAFRVVDRLTEKIKTTKKGTSDGRTRARGSICENFESMDLINILVTLGITPIPEKTAEAARASLAEMRKYLKLPESSPLTIPELRLRYAWKLNTRRIMCEALRDYLEDHDLVITI